MLNLNPQKAREAFNDLLWLEKLGHWRGLCMPAWCNVIKQELPVPVHAVVHWGYEECARQFAAELGIPLEPQSFGEPPRSDRDQFGDGGMRT